MARLRSTPAATRHRRKTPSNWSGGSHALAAIGPLTEAVVTDILDRDPAYSLFHKLEDEDLKTLAQTMQCGWSDAQTARVIEEYAKLPEQRRHVEVGAVCKWVRQHPDDADSVVDCMSVTAPDGVSLIKVLSQAGSQKRVYLANWKLTLKEIVLKRLIGTPAQQVAIFERESQTHPFSMGHPNIIETHPLTNASGEKFLAEERLPVVLTDGWESEGVQEAANLLYDVSKALSYIHEELGLVHGDIKPANIGSRDGAYILLDFGICRPKEQFSREATATGSLRTRAPELFDEGYIDPPKADVWSIAATVYKAITSRFPFVDPDESVPRISHPSERVRFERMIGDRIRNHFDARVDLGLVPDPLRAVLAAALTRYPADRASARQLTALCEKNLAGFLRSNPGTGRITAAEELRQLLNYLPRDGSLGLMPVAVKRVMAARLESFRQLIPLASRDVREVQTVLDGLR